MSPFCVSYNGYCYTLFANGPILFLFMFCTKRASSGLCYALLNSFDVLCVNSEHNKEKRKKKNDTETRSTLRFMTGALIRSVRQQYRHVLTCFGFFFDFLRIFLETHVKRD